MYTAIVNTVMWITLLKGALWVIGIPACFAFIYFIIRGAIRQWSASEHGVDDDNKGWAKFYFAGTGCFVVFAMMIAIGCSKFAEPEWMMLRMAAPTLDKYVETHPDTIYNPEKALSLVNDTALSIVGSVQEFPKILAKLASGQSIKEAQEDLKREAEAKEMEEFRKWKSSQVKN